MRRFEGEARGRVRERAMWQVENRSLDRRNVVVAAQALVLGRMYVS